VQAASSAPPDQAAVTRHDGFRNRWYLDALYGRGYPADTVDLLGAFAPQVRSGDMAAIAAPIDFLGVNYYFPEVVRDAPGKGFLQTEVVYPEGRERTGFGWEVAPQGLSGLLQRIARDYQPARIFVTENGSSYDDVVLADGSIEDEGRRQYLERHLEATRSARAAGVPVEGYFAWSLLDNFEWAEGYLRRFGLAYVDFASQRRTLKRSGRWFQAFLAR
jgi:beta-glucosidase